MVRFNATLKCVMFTQACYLKCTTHKIYNYNKADLNIYTRLVSKSQKVQIKWLKHQESQGK